MNDGLVITLTRTQADAAAGHTGFEVDIGLTYWHIELEHLACLFASEHLREVLLMPIGSSRQVCLSAALLEPKGAV